MWLCRTNLLCAYVSNFWVGNIWKICCQHSRLIIKGCDLCDRKLNHILFCGLLLSCYISPHHDDVIKWKHFPRYWPLVRRIHRSPVKSPHKGQWRGPLMFFFIYVCINGWVNNREAGDLRRYLAHNDVTVMVRHLGFSVSMGSLRIDNYCLHVTLYVNSLHAKLFIAKT